MHIFCRLILTISVLFSVSVSHAQVKKKVVKKTTAAPLKLKAKPKAPVTILPVKALGVRVKITTEMGEIVVRLSDKTPQHRDNFIKLVNDHFYDSLIFHRIIAGFMI